MQAWIIWLILSLIFVIVEIFTITFYFLILAIGALFASILAWFNLHIYWQIIGASLVILALIPFLPKFLSKYFIKNSRNSKMAGDIGILEGEFVKNAYGVWLVKYQGDTYPYKFKQEPQVVNLTEGLKVKILRFDGITAIIEV